MRRRRGINALSNGANRPVSRRARAQPSRPIKRMGHNPTWVNTVCITEATMPHYCDFYLSLCDTSL
jgi:hypothetical protein